MREKRRKREQREKKERKKERGCKRNVTERKILPSGISPRRETAAMAPAEAPEI